LASEADAEKNDKIIIRKRSLASEGGWPASTTPMLKMKKKKIIKRKGSLASGEDGLQ